MQLDYLVQNDSSTRLVDHQVVSEGDRRHVADETDVDPLDQDPDLPGVGEGLPGEDSLGARHRAYAPAQKVKENEQEDEELDGAGVGFDSTRGNFQPVSMANITSD